MILKSIPTEKACVTRDLCYSGRQSLALDELYDYIVDPVKTCSLYISGSGCSPTSFIPLSKAVKKHYGKTANKQIRHFVISLSNMEHADSEKLLDFSAEVCNFFEGKYYVLFAVHVDRPHMHVHFIVNNTSHLDGRQLSFGESELSHFKEYVNGIALKYGFSAIEKIDTSTDEPLEVSETLFEHSDSNDLLDLLTNSEIKSRNNSFSESRSLYNDQYKHGINYGDYPPIVNLFVPYNFQISTYIDRSGRYQISAKPYFWYDPNGSLIKRQDNTAFEVEQQSMSGDYNECNSSNSERTPVIMKNPIPNFDYFKTTNAWWDKDGAFHKE